MPQKSVDKIPRIRRFLCMFLLKEYVLKLLRGPPHGVTRGGCEDKGRPIPRLIDARGISRPYVCEVSSDAARQEIDTGKRELPVRPCPDKVHNLGEIDDRATVGQERIFGEPNLLEDPDPPKPRLLEDLHGVEQPVGSDRPITAALLLRPPPTAIGDSGFHHVLRGDSIEVFNHVESYLCRFAIVSVVSKTDNDPPCVRIDLSHHIDMNSLLLEVMLVDAKRIDPKMSRFVSIPDLTQSINEICCHINLKTLAGDRAGIFCAAPGVRYCFVFLKRICILVFLSISLAVSKNRNSFTCRLKRCEIQ